MAEEISQFLQENLLSLLAFDDARAPIIANVVDAALFEGDYRQVATALYKYINKHNKAPKNHIADLLEDVLEKKDRKAQRFEGLLKHLHKSKDTVNGVFVMERLATFVRRQKLKGATLEVAEIFNTDRMDDDALEKVEGIFNTALREKMSVFEPGTRLGDPSKSLAFLDETDGEVFLTGIKQLDELRLGPIRGGLHLFIGLPKAGKTHWLISFGKQAYRSGYKVLHISLEMKEKKITQRYVQSLFAIAKRPNDPGKAGSSITKFRLDEDGRLEGLRQKAFRPKHTLQDKNIRKKLRKRMTFLGNRLNRILVKDFPTGSLTIPALEAYLQTLEHSHNFIPDLILVDYPQLFKIDPKNLRGELGRIVIGLRGIAGKYNAAVATVAQSNRKGLSSKRVGSENVGEDFSQIATADAVVTYSRTSQEKALGLARLHVAASRDEEDDFTILMSQHYATGQFCRQSVRMQKQYWDILQAEAGSDKDSDEEDEDAGNHQIG